VRCVVAIDHSGRRDTSTSTQVLLIFHCLISLFRCLPPTSKPPENASGLAFLILVQHAPNSVQGCTCPNPPYINVLATPISFLPVPSPSRTSPDNFLHTIHSFSILLVRLHDHTLDSTLCTLRSHQSLHLFHADKRRTATMFRHRDDLLTPPHSLRRRQQQESRHSEAGPPGFDLRSGHIISGTSNQMLDLSICHPSQAFSK
jgi:hypothetical protein